MAWREIARFSHRWEAEFAGGFLSDAGIPAQIVEDGMAGSGPYVGDLGGASLRVPDEDREEALSTLQAAGVLPDPEAPKPIPLEDRPLPPVVRADVEDLRERIRLARREETRHGIYALIGLTPAALIPLVAFVLEGRVELLVLLMVLVVFVEGWRWIRAGKDVRRLEDQLRAIEAEVAGGDPDA